MKSTILRVAAALALEAVAALARAHELTCSETATILHVDRNGDVVVGGDGLPVGTGGITPVLELRAYPAVDFGGGTASGAHAFVAKLDPLGNLL